MLILFIGWHLPHNYTWISDKENEQKAEPPEKFINRHIAEWNGGWRMGSLNYSQFNLEKCGWKAIFDPPQSFCLVDNKAEKNILADM